MKGFITCLSVALLLTGCATPRMAPSCPAGVGSPMRIFDLYFGLAIEGRGNVTDAEWDKFRDEFITPNLPSGYTVMDGKGAWMDPKTHITGTEATKILIAATPDTVASLAAVQRVRAGYEKTLHQISVGMTTHLTCGSFDD
jgi:hypothetical protein